MSFLLALSILATTFAPGAIASGEASWYSDARRPQGSFYGAVPHYRDGHPYWATVQRGKSKIRVWVSDGCRCPNHRVIDLSWNAFVHLGLPLSRGVMIVTVTRP